ncbi:MAG: hypothetical protein NT066_07265, partial [Candidatus Omnitrophica bacterium]|nr:hypothetical protein [Candidatus Omnitrophota bacterium]
YDKMLERLGELLQSSTLYIGGPSPILDKAIQEKGHLLKLHGSVNWFYCPREDCVHNKAFYDTYREGEIKEVPINQLCIACGEKLERAIIPPTMSKVFF